MRLINNLLILGIMAISACNGDPSRLPADVVNIPNSASGSVSENALPEMKFVKLEHDFGQVVMGEVVTYAFKFRNTGKGDLVIANISASCGCTASNFPKQPIKPGEENFIEVSFNSEGRLGFQNKTLTVAANTQPGTIVLTIKAKVVSPEFQ